MSKWRLVIGSERMVPTVRYKMNPLDQKWLGFVIYLAPISKIPPWLARIETKSQKREKRWCWLWNKFHNKKIVNIVLQIERKGDLDLDKLISTTYLIINIGIYFIVRKI